MASTDPRPHAWSMCAACFFPCIPLSRETPLGRSRYQTSELPNTSELPKVTLSEGLGFLAWTDATFDVLRFLRADNNLVDIFATIDFSNELN